MAISSTTGPFARGTAMISGLFPMMRSAPPHGGHDLGDGRAVGFGGSLARLDGPLHG